MIDLFRIIRVQFQLMSLISKTLENPCIKWEMLLRDKMMIMIIDPQSEKLHIREILKFKFMVKKTNIKILFTNQNLDVQLCPQPISQKQWEQTILLILNTEENRKSAKLLNHLALPHLATNRTLMITPLIKMFKTLKNWPT